MESQRAQAYRELFAVAHQHGVSVPTFLEPNLESARVRLGTSVADFVLPFVLDEELVGAFDHALLELALLWATRNRPQLGEETFERFLLTDHGVTAPLRGVAYGPPPGLKSEALRAVLSFAPGALPSCDAGVLASWLGSEGRGRGLVQLWAALLLEATEEMGRAGDEETVTFVQWAVLSAAARAPVVAAQYRLAPGAERVMNSALLLGLHLAHHVVREQVVAGCRDRFTEGSRLRALWHGYSSPRLGFASAPAALDLCRFSSVRAECLGEHRPRYEKDLSGRVELEAIERGLGRLFDNDRGIREATLSQLARARRREAVLTCLAPGGAIPNELRSRLAAWHRDPDALERLCADRGARKDAVRDLTAAARSLPGDANVAAPLTVLANRVARADKKPEKQLEVETEAMKRAVVECLLVDLCDGLIGRVGRQVNARFLLRSGAETDRDLTEQYDGGRLYWIGRRGRPVLNEVAPTARASVGHYFIDLKDFTRRTAMLKEESMAEFLRVNFYGPILGIAHDHYGGLSGQADRGGVYVNNLLGDAVSISGDIISMVEIARAIRRHLRQYAEALEARARQDGLADRADAVRFAFDSRRNELGQRRRRITEKLGAADASEQDAARRELRALAAEEEQLKLAAEAELAQVTGEHLISGSFISYGAPPTVIVSEDALWGTQKVSISEKINESARGTARLGSVLGSLEALARMQGTTLELPFQVNVGGKLELSIEPAVEVALRAAFAAGDGARALQLFTEAARAHVAMMMADDSARRERGALHNAGDALSGEALAAYRDARAGQARYVDAQLSVAQLGPAWQHRFATLQPTLELVLGTSDGNQIDELFHLAGSVAFKGLESSPTEVWEMVDLESPAGVVLCADPAVRAVLGLGPRG